MEFIRINSEKIKVFLSYADMEKLGINYDMLDGTDEHGRNAFNKIMADIKDNSGFATNGKRIFVQIFPSKDGGCEIFITRLNDKKFTVVRKKKNVCYLFNDLNCLLQFCNVVGSRDFDGQSAFYIDEKNKKYYICVDREMPFAAEFYGRKCATNADAYISEHCVLITEEAIGKLGALG